MKETNLTLSVIILIITTLTAIILPSVSAACVPEYGGILGIGVYDSNNVEFFNQYARSDDLILFRLQVIEFVDDVTVGKKVLVFGPQEDLNEMVSLAKEKDFDIFSYNLEISLSIEEYLAKEKEAYELAKANGFPFVFATTSARLARYYTDFAQYADVLVLQVQGFQREMTLEEYEEAVGGLIDDVKSVGVQVWVQVFASLNNPDNGRIQLSADEVIDYINIIENKTDAIIIYYTTKDTDIEVMEEVFKRLRTLERVLGDLNDDCVVDIQDLSIIGTNFGKTTGINPPEADANDDGVVNLLDLYVVAKNFGEQYEE